MSIKPTFDSDRYDDGMTKQAYAKDCDINAILKKAQRTGALSHLAQFGGVYGDFAGLDFQTMQNQIAEANNIFERLPSEVRREFEGDPSKFFAYVNDPANVNRLAELLPAIAEPGSFFPRVNAQQRAPDVAPKGPSGEAASPSNAPQADSAVGSQESSAEE